MADLAQDHAELGATLNGFSLNETGQLSTAVEKTGQAVDATYMSTTKLVRSIVLFSCMRSSSVCVQLQEFEQNWAEPLHEYTQFASIIKKLLQYRHQKHVQYEMTQEALEAKREQLEELEKNEREARRLEEALSQGRPSTIRASTSRSDDGEEAAGTGEQEGEEEGPSPSHRQEESAYLPPHPGPNPVKRRAPGMGLLSALSYTLHGMMDVDPETARRNSITKNKETISQVRERVFMRDLDWH